MVEARSHLSILVGPCSDLLELVSRYSPKFHLLFTESTVQRVPWPMKNHSLGQHSVLPHLGSVPRLDPPTLRWSESERYEIKTEIRIKLWTIHENSVFRIIELQISLNLWIYNYKLINHLRSKVFKCFQFGSTKHWDTLPIADKDQASDDPHGHALAWWTWAKPRAVWHELIHSECSQGTNLTWPPGYSQALQGVAQSIRSLDLMPLLEMWICRQVIHDSEVPETVQPSGGLTLVHQDFQGPQTRTKTVTDPFIQLDFLHHSFCFTIKVALAGCALRLRALSNLKYQGAAVLSSALSRRQVLCLNATRQKQGKETIEDYQQNISWFLTIYLPSIHNQKQVALHSLSNVWFDDVLFSGTGTVAAKGRLPSMGPKTWRFAPDFSCSSMVSTKSCPS